MNTQHMLDVYGSPLYQWDINRQLRIDSVDIGSDFEVHCCHTDDSTSLVVTPIIEDDVILVNIPNILLQRSGFIRVYVVVAGDTIYDRSFYVMARPKPDDYIYTETEVLSYKDIDKRMKVLEDGLGDQVAEEVESYLAENPPPSGVYFETDKTLSLKDGVLSVNTADVAEADNTLPITSAAVHTQIGNIEVLLRTI